VGRRGVIFFNVDKIGAVQLLCNVHPEMSGWFIVTENLYALVTEHDGKFSLTNVPAASYEIAFWSEKLKRQEMKSFTVTDGETTAVVLTMVE